jgi:hypothetical protein
MDSEALAADMKIQDFAGREPRFLIEDYFAGSMRAWGLFEDRFGNIRREFTVDMTGGWQGREFVLDEFFVYSDGETSHRTWRIIKHGEHVYEGRAADVIGVARGVSHGNAANWRYVIDLPVGKGVWRVGFDDWMLLQRDGVLLNRAHVNRWGIWIGTLSIAFKRPEPRAAERRAPPLSRA